MSSTHKNKRKNQSNTLQPGSAVVQSGPNTDNLINFTSAGVLSEVGHLDTQPIEEETAIAGRSVHEVDHLAGNADLYDNERKQLNKSG